MLICQNDLRETLRQIREEYPFPDVEPYVDRAVIAEGWLYGSTLGFHPIDEVASEFDRMFGRDDFARILARFTVDSVSDPSVNDEFRILSMSVSSEGVNVSFFVHPKVTHLLNGYTSLMYFETVRGTVQ